MAISEFNVVIGRIYAATPHSPIAVFTTDMRGELESVFHDTITTRARIERGDSRYVGSFHMGMDMKEVKKILRAAI